jgi:cytochrome c-type biogenesis protein CcmE
LSEIEKRLWLVLCGLAMIVQGAVLVLTGGYINTHLYVQVALLYGDRELSLHKTYDEIESDGY